MNGTVFNIFLSIWLTLSALIWLAGFGFAGGFYLPPLDLFTMLAFYAPWLLLLAFGIRAWVSRERNA